MEKQTNWYSILRRIVLIIGMVSVVFVFLTSLFFNYNSLSWRFPLYDRHNTFIDGVFLIRVSLCDWFIIRPLMMLCFGFCAIAGKKPEKPLFTFKFDYLVWFAAALVLFVPCAIACGYGIRFDMPEPRTFISYLYEVEFLRVTMMLAAGMFLGEGCRSLAQNTSK